MGQPHNYDLVRQGEEADVPLEPAQPCVAQLAMHLRIRRGARQHSLDRGSELLFEVLDQPGGVFGPPLARLVQIGNYFRPEA